MANHVVTESALARWEALSDEERERRLGQLTTPGSAVLADPGGTQAASTTQHTQFVIEQTVGDGPSPYSLPFALHLSGAYDRAALIAATKSLVMDLPVLRSVFRARMGVEAEAMRLESTLLEPFGLEVESVAPGQLRRRMTEIGQRAQRMGEPGLFRATLLVTEADQDVLMLCGHHCIMDGLSMSMVIDSLAERYRARRAGRTASGALPSYRALIPSIEARHDAAAQAGAAWWRDYLDGGVPARIPPDATPPRGIGRFAGGHIERALPLDVWNRLTAVAHATGAGDAAALLAVMAVVCARHMREQDLVLGLSTTGRRTSSEMECVGPFADTVPVRMTVEPEATLADLVRGMAGGPATGGVENELPFSRLVAEVGAERGRGHNPLYDVLVTMDPMAEPAQTVDDSLSWRIGGMLNGTARVALQVTASPAGDAVRLRFDHSLREYTTAYAEQLADEVVRAAAELSIAATTVGSLGTGLGQRVAGPLLSEPVDTLRQFAIRVGAHPERPALRDGRLDLSYAQVDRLANQLAGAFVARTEVGDRVAWRGGLSALTPVVILAIFRAGLVYVPIAGDAPAPRLEAMLRDAEVSLIVDRLGNELAAALIDPASGESAPVELDPDAPADAVSRPHPLAYIMFTSGSTGRPKGVAVSHRALRAFLASMAAEGYLREAETVLAITGTTFDISFDELLLPLTVGATVRIGPGKITAGVRPVLDLIEAGQIEVLHGTPSFYQLLLAGGWSKPVARILVGGEALTNQLAQQLRQRTSQVVNLYGPTEATVWALSSVVVAEDLVDARSPLIGRPLSGYQAMVVNDDLVALPAGVPGELCLGGAALAEGYVGLDELTAQRFVSTDQGRVYRTGDLARIRLDGQVEFLGRRDTMVKVRGHRIELEDIEAAVRTLPGVADCAAAVVGEVIAVLTVGTPEGQMRQRLAAKLPEVMVPAFHLCVDALPLTPNGKLDRRAVTELLADRKVPVAAEPERLAAEPYSETEAWVAAVWQELLGRPIDRYDNLFDAGGHSLVLAWTAAMARTEFGIDVPLDEMFAEPTVDGVGRLLTTAVTELDEILGLVASLSDDEARRLMEG